MTLAELRAAAAKDPAPSGTHARAAVDALDAKDWKTAQAEITKAATLDPAAYIPALPLVGVARAGSVKSERKLAAVRANGKKGGRPVTTGAGLKRKRRPKPPQE
jgi:hypothetical protein